MQLTQLTSALLPIHFLMKLDVLFTIWTCYRWNLSNCKHCSELNKVTKSAGSKHTWCNHKNIILNKNYLLRSWQPRFNRHQNPVNLLQVQEVCGRPGDQIGTWRWVTGDRSTTMDPHNWANPQLSMGSNKARSVPLSCGVTLSTDLYTCLHNGSTPTSIPAYSYWDNLFASSKELWDWLIISLWLPGLLTVNLHWFCDKFLDAMSLVNYSFAR